jgi:DNA polymerase III epsilon subunit-like protein
MDHRLADLHILALDCQATGANPGKGHLLEIGWATGRAATTSGSDQQQVQSHLIRQPPQIPIPPVVQRLTGITQDAMTIAVSAETAWCSLDQAARATAARNQLILCPTVIHFARFETPFLRQLHSANASQTPFPLHLICTHTIAARLLPELPRRGIRALAGYFGHPMPELRRSADHALATLVIWKALVDLLQTRCNVHSLAQLTCWLADAPLPGRTRRVYPMDPAVRSALTDTPGVYRMLRENADILYIGKAKSLKKRVNSYFRPRAPHPEHILEMLSQARDLDFSPTGSALEAALQESDEIKLHLCVQEGLTIFRNNYQSHLQHRSALRAVTILGAKFHRQQQEAVDAAQARAECQADEEENLGLESAVIVEQPAWTPETVAIAMEHMLTRAAHLIRRARWYALISESCLCWAPAGKPDGPGNLLVFEAGRISQRQFLHAAKNVPPPPGHGRSWHERRKALDLAVYDRLRVFTTELRRLICDDRLVELRVGPNKGLNLSALKKALPWV